MNETFILFNAEAARKMFAFIKAHAAEQVELGRPLKVVVSWSRNKMKRSDEQNAYMWSAVIDHIVEQVCVQGRRYNAKSWNEALKEMHLPDVSNSGVEKWAYGPTGSRRLNMSTTDLDVEEMSMYLDQIQAYAANEHGVVFPEKQPEEIHG